MDVISILGPGALQRTFNQDEFDARFNYLSPLEKNEDKKSYSNYIRRCIKENWSTHKCLSDYFPALNWIVKYDIKGDLPRDLLGSLLLSSLFLPQAITSGVLAVDNAYAGIYSFFIPQLIYPLFGSSRHCSLGALSFVSFLVKSSIDNSHTNAATLSLVCSIIHIILAIFPLDSLISLVPDQLLSGYSAGLSIRLLWYLLLNCVSLDRKDCMNNLLNVPFSSIPECIISSTGWILLLSFISLSILIISHYIVLIRSTNSLPVTPPFQLALMLSSIALSYTLDLPSHGVKILGKSSRSITFSFPTLSPIGSSLLDGLAISLFGIALHLKIAKTIAVEKMHTIDRKQELVTFSSFQFILSFLGLPPIGSAHGKSQLNIETARFSLVSNVIAVAWIIIFVSFAGSILKNLPYCVVACIVVTSFPGFMGELRILKKLNEYTKIDTSIWIISFILSLICPNICQGFLIAAICPLLSIVIRLQRPSSDIIVRVPSDSPAYFAEENHYESDIAETPAKIYRFNAPLIFANCDLFRKEVTEHAKSIKGALALGIGTRTGSMRSQLEPKDSISKSRNNLTNIVIYQEPSTPPNPSMDNNSIVRVLIIDCSSLTEIDSHGIDTMIDIYFELQELSIRVIYASASVRLRTILQLGGFFSRVSRACLYPSLTDAYLAARHSLLPIHTSVSMNGCRDVIALSTATSNHEELHEAAEMV